MRNFLHLDICQFEKNAGWVAQICRLGWDFVGLGSGFVGY